jgi:UDP-N-acetylglucosamine acyltransferase
MGSGLLRFLHKLGPSAPRLNEAPERMSQPAMPKISSHAVVDPKASLADDVEVGPFCLIGPNVTLDSGCRLISHVSISGHTRIGRNNVFHPNAVIGGPPQDLRYKGEPTRLEIGESNVFREAVTLHRGTASGGGITRIGSGNLFMVNAHVGHDGQIGNHCTLANNVMLAGHVICHDNVIMNGGVGVNQYVTVGEFSWIGGYSRIHYDVPPFSKVDGPDLVRAPNPIGLRRAGFPEADIEELEQVHRYLFSRQKPLAMAMAEFSLSNGINPLVKRLIEFMQRRTGSMHGRYQETLMKAG